MSPGHKCRCGSIGMGHLSSHTKSEKYGKCRERDSYGLQVAVHIKVGLGLVEDCSPGR